MTLRTHFIALLTAGGLALASLSAWSAPADDAAAATADLFTQMSARNLAAVSRYVPAQGFSEIGPGANAPHQLDRKAFEGLFASDMTIDLHATALQARMVGGTAIVTGMRIGAVTAAHATPVEGRMLFTSVWAQDAGQWQLQHIHLSAAAPAP